MNKQELKNIIKEIETDKLNEFLADLLLNNENIMNQFRSNFINNFPKITKEEYERKIWNAIYECRDKDGFISYSNARKYTHAMYNFTSEAQELINNKNYESAFDIVTSILDSIPDIPIDDSNGSTGAVADECIEIIEEIVGYTLLEETELNKKILDYILEEIKTYTLSNYGIELYPILNYYIDEKKYLEEILSSLNYSIKKYPDKWNTEKYKKLKSDIKELLVKTTDEKRQNWHNEINLQA